jgi:hypothetical protein
MNVLKIMVYSFLLYNMLLFGLIWYKGSVMIKMICKNSIISSTSSGANTNFTSIPSTAGYSDHGGIADAIRAFPSGLIVLRISSID